MKIKIGQSWGTEIDRDIARVNTFRDLAGPGVDLMVDANGGYTAGQARRVGAALDRLGVVWFEEPVSSDDLTGLAAVRAAVHCDVAAGEYAADLYDVARLCPVVDCLQLDVTRCGGYTGWLRGAAVAAGAQPADLGALRARPARARWPPPSQPAARRVVHRPRPPRTAPRRRRTHRPTRRPAPQ